MHPVCARSGGTRLRSCLHRRIHQTYSLTPDGRVELDNINGPVHISTWDRSEVKIDAVKYAGTKERLDEASIEIDSGKDYLSIRTKYPDHDQTFNWGSRNNPAGVEYTLTVPRSARLDEIKLINGSLDITGDEWRSARLLHQRQAGSPQPLWPSRTLHHQRPSGCPV